MSRFSWTAVVLLVAAAATLRSRELFEPWSGLHKAWGGAMYGGIARNMVRYDPRETGFAPLTNAGPLVARNDFEYYYHYPPLLVSMVAVSYRVFGVHEGSARLIPLAFSLLIMWLVFAFARQFWDMRVAALALAFVSFLPVELYYADHVDVYGPPAVFFSALAVFAYSRWYQHRRRGDLVLTVAALALGCLTAWYTYFVVPLLAVHALLVAPRERRPSLRVPAMFAVTAVAVFAAFLLHRRLLVGAGGSEVAGSLLQKLLIRSAWTNLAIPTPGGLVPVTLAGFALHLAKDVVRMHGPVLALVAVWFVMITRAARRRRLEDRDWFLLMLLGYGLLHNLAFPMLLPGHDFLSRCFSLGFAIAAAVALGAMADRIEAHVGARAAGAVVLLAVGAGLVSGLVLARRIQPGGGGERIKLWATFLREGTAPETVVQMPDPEDQVFLYYLDRRVRWNVKTPANLRDSIPDGAPAVFALRDRDVARYPELVAALDSEGGYAAWNGLRVYRRNRDAPAP